MIRVRDRRRAVVYLINPRIVVKLRVNQLRIDDSPPHQRRLIIAVLLSGRRLHGVISRFAAGQLEVLIIDLLRRRRTVAIAFNVLIGILPRRVGKLYISMITGNHARLGRIVASFHLHIVKRVMPKPRIAIIRLMICCLGSFTRLEVHVYHALTNLAVNMKGLRCHDHGRVIRIFQRIVSIAVFDLDHSLDMIRTGHVALWISIRILGSVFHHVRFDLDALIAIRLQQSFIVNIVHLAAVGVINGLRSIINLIVSGIRLNLDGARRDRITGHSMIAFDHIFRRGIEDIIARELRLNARYRIIDRPSSFSSVLIRISTGALVHDLDDSAVWHRVEELQPLVSWVSLCIVFVERCSIQGRSTVILFYGVILLFLNIPRDNGQRLDLPLIRCFRKVQRIRNGIVLGDLLFRRGPMIRHVLESVRHALILNRLMPGVGIRGKGIRRAFAVLPAELIQSAARKRERLPVHPDQRYAARDIRLTNRRRRIEIPLGFADIRRHDRLIDGALARKLSDGRAMLVNQSQGVILIDLAVSGQSHRIIDGLIRSGVFVRICSAHRIA